MMLAINTGAWTALCSLFTIITVRHSSSPIPPRSLADCALLRPSHAQLAAFPDFQAYLALELVICPLYCNAVLANLNSRGFIRGDTVVDTSGASISGGADGRGPRSGSGHHASTFRAARASEVRVLCYLRFPSPFLSFPLHPPTPAHSTASPFRFSARVPC